MQRIQLAVCLERPPTGGLSLLFFVLRSSSVEDLKEVCCPPSHPRVDVRLCISLALISTTASGQANLGCLDVIVKVVSKSLYVGYVFLPPLRREMSRE